MRALFTSKNLIGDALYVQPALKVWAEQHPGWEIDLMTNDDHISCLYEGMGIPNMVLCWKPLLRKYDFEHEFQVNKAFDLGGKENLHISKAYAKLLGVEIPDNVRVEYTPPEGDSEKDRVLLSMFSNSCASRKGQRPNKMLSWAYWLPVLTLARQVGEVGILGGPADKAPMHITDKEYLIGLPLPKVARILRDAKLLITIDNGMGHLAATQGTPTILFYPACLGTSWIVPSGNPNLLLCHMDPCVITAEEMKHVVRQGLKKFLRG